MSAWVAWANEGHPNIVAVFSTLEKAEAFVTKQLETGFVRMDHIEEWVLDEEPSGGRWLP